MLVIAGAMVGAPLRYLIDRAVASRYGAAFPWGTLVVNTLGSFVLGLLAAGALAGAVPGSVTSLLGTGLCGALTTYSTFSYETVRLFTDGARLSASLNVVAGVVAGFAAAGLGTLAGTAIWG
ncbi:putative fluoride ion transporter CrcB 2 [Phytomonospora endophytica]|nr:putative fluoride ion transporter CrcB 2 [Phytomonospora endophytica]